MKLTFVYKQTWLHRVNPSLKLILSLLMLIIMLFIHQIDVMVYMAVLLLIILFTSTGHPKKRLLLYASPMLLLFISSMSTMTLFGKGTTVWFDYGPIHVTEEGFIRGLHIGLRALCFSAVGLLFALSTRPVLLFYSLMQQLKLPPKYAYSFMAGIRLIPMMVEELQTLRHALQVRGSDRSGLAGLWLKLRRYAVPMLAQSIRRAQRIAVAMEAKRFAGIGPRTYYYIVSVSRFDLLCLIGVVVVMGISFWAGQRFPLLDVEDVRFIDGP